MRNRAVLSNNKINLIKLAALSFLAVFCCFAFLSISLQSCFAESVSADTELPSINYLDYKFNEPSAVYADDEIIAVADGDKTIFFYDGKIYERAMRIAGNFARNGEYLYYSKSSVLGKIKIGVFEHEEVTDERGNNIGANAFSLKGNRLITLTNTGIEYYENFTRATLSYAFLGDVTVSALKAANVCIGDNYDYYCINGNLYKNNERICVGVAEYMAEANGKLYFTNQDGVFVLNEKQTELVLSKPANGTFDSVKGITDYNGQLLFVNGKTQKLTVCSYDGSIEKDFIFNVKIQTNCSVKFIYSPVTVKIKNGQSIHHGTLNTSGLFQYENTRVLTNDEEYVLLGETEGYAVLYGKNGYALIKNTLTEKVNLSPQTNKQTVYVLFDCTAYPLPVADEIFQAFQVKKGDKICTLAIYTMNGVNYVLIETTDGKTAFVPQGETTGELLPNIPENEDKQSEVTGTDYTVEAVVIILLSTSVFVLAIFVIYSKKENVKL